MQLLMGNAYNKVNAMNLPFFCLESILFSLLWQILILMYALGLSSESSDNFLRLELGSRLLPRLRLVVSLTYHLQSPTVVGRS